MYFERTAARPSALRRTWFLLAQTIAIASWMAAHFPEVLLRRLRRQLEERGAVLSHVPSPSRPPKESV